MNSEYEIEDRVRRRIRRLRSFDKHSQEAYDWEDLLGVWQAFMEEADR